MSLVETIHARASQLGNNQLTTTWSHEQFVSLRSCWEEGLSGAQTAALINKEFGTCYTRSAIIGKANREGLSAKGHSGGGRTKQYKPKAPRPAREPAPQPDVTDFLIPFAQRKTLLQLEYGDCKWPVGHPDEPGFFFCGGKALETYCAAHASRAFYRR